MHEQVCKLFLHNRSLYLSLSNVHKSVHLMVSVKFFISPSVKSKVLQIWKSYLKVKRRVFKQKPSRRLGGVLLLQQRPSQPLCALAPGISDDIFFTLYHITRKRRSPSSPFFTLLLKGRLRFSEHTHFDQKW